MMRWMRSHYKLTHWSWVAWWSLAGVSLCLSCVMNIGVSWVSVPSSPVHCGMRCRSQVEQREACRGHESTNTRHMPDLCRHQQGTCRTDLWKLLLNTQKVGYTLTLCQVFPRIMAHWHVIQLSVPYFLLSYYDLYFKSLSIQRHDLFRAWKLSESGLLGFRGNISAKGWWWSQVRINFTSTWKIANSCFQVSWAPCTPSHVTSTWPGCWPSWWSSARTQRPGAWTWRLSATGLKSRWC